MIEKARHNPGGTTMSPKYIMSFTAGALLHRESVKLAEQYAHDQDWSVARQVALDENLLQSKTQNTSKRLIQETVGRLQTLTEEQFSVLLDGTEEEQRHILWLAICKRYRFIWDFAVEVLRERFLQRGAAITRSDYETFFSTKAAWHPELEALGASTRERLRQNLFKILREASLLSNEGEAIGAFLSPGVLRALARDSVDNLTVFPVREEDAERWAKQ